MIIPIFPLGLVMFPFSFQTLHIFEERYKEMINTCIQEEKEFGIVYYDGKDISNIGTSCKISSIIDKFDDGRINLIVEGNKRFKINDLISDKSYLQADIDFFDDEYETSGIELEKVSKESLSLLENIISFFDKDYSEYIKNLDVKAISFLIIANSELSNNEKQKFLEMINTKERLEKGKKVLEIIIERMDYTKRISKIINSNGYLGSKHII